MDNLLVSVIIIN